MTKSFPRQREIIAGSLGRLGVIVPAVSLVTGAAVVAVQMEAKAWQLRAVAALLLVNALAFLLARLQKRQGENSDAPIRMD